MIDQIKANILSEKFDLNKKWTFSLAKSSYSYEAIANKNIKSGERFAATVPGTIHTDLLNNNLIDDPFYSDNELKMKWISECDWLYQTKFDFNGNSSENYDLVFEGIDTISKIYLNGVKLGGTDNMFIAYIYNVKYILKPTDNTLKVLIKSPVKYATQQERKYGKLPVALNSNRVYIRKAQYSFGWDWGPSFPTSGIWRKVYLQQWTNIKIESITFNTISINKKNAEVEVNVGTKFLDNNNFSLKVSLSNEDIHYEQSIPISSSKKQKIKFKIKNPKLWWPNGEGDQNLYLLQVKIVDNNIVLDEVKRNVGIRTIDLLLKDKEASTFKFRINNRDIYCKGVNWIPADSFLPRVTNKKYSELLSLAKQANMNIVRVWGGGIYENDEFYKLCDELGLLVWQDFMFACGSYPENDNFIANISEEVTQNVLRIQYHPCLAILCGNNENEWIWFQEQKISYKEMPGYKIYHKLIPDILKKIDPTIPYWSSSPFGDDENPNSFESGNTHQWNIWSRWIDYDEVKNDRSLFVTEFGFQGPANKETFEKWLPANNRNVSDRIFEYHNKQIEGPERILKFLSSHLPIKTDWDDYLYLAQLNQAFALKTCLEHWRTNGRTNGSIIWQINDCWPVTSWAIIDSEIKPKISYYFVKNAFSPILLYFMDNGTKIKVNLLNQNRISIKGKLRLTIINTVSGEIKKDNFYKVSTANKSIMEIKTIAREKLPRDDNWIITTVLYNESNQIISRNYFLTKPWKHMVLKKSELKLKVRKRKDGTSLLLKSNYPVFFIDVYHQKFSFSDCGFFILPEEEIEIKASAKKTSQLRIKDIKTYSLNDYLKK
jgi:beta-mannosidase